MLWCHFKTVFQAAIFEWVLAIEGAVLCYCDEQLHRLAQSQTLLFIKADFHSVQNVARSTFSERFLLNYKQSSGTNLISCG